MTALLSLSSLSCQRGEGPGRFSLSVPSLSVSAGQAIAITGPSGCGKSTLLDVLGLVLRPGDEGSFFLGTVNVGQLWRQGEGDRLAALRAAHIGYILQTGGLLPFLTVRDNLLLPGQLLQASGRRAGTRKTGTPEAGGHKAGSGKDKDSGDLLNSLVQALGLQDLLDRKPRALSVGQRQRVAVARALSHRPSLVLADEPTSSLDPDNAAQVMELMLDLVFRLGSSLVLVSHDEPLMRRFGLPCLHVASGPQGAALQPAPGREQESAGA